ncbi:MAG: hypothetical protein PR2021_6980 [Candidatus Phytoplasma pruni]|nr:hypothetical protein [Poinsettia branch-inducing phytoplasma]WEK82760.1 MAG: hypothetical protein PR2021_6980 [Candidatus Phytoplasma pruni]
MEETRKIIKENKDLLDKIANTLLAKETINREEIEKLIGESERP